MEFCPKCGSIIVITEKRIGCASCRYKPKKKPKIEISEEIKKNESVAVIKDSGGDEIYPVIDEKCIKCKNKKAYFWTKQTRAADETETKFYKCTKCKHTWRKYR